ncbi:hypothetical protein RUR49_19675 [Pseudoxanthobacter sp. M-2]|uniref:hypothetical protein n=1 Tax=Pseudoxanthobacter sp. M-2 TaxID=3078754 RepID=UPI0038FC1428
MTGGPAARSVQFRLHRDHLYLDAADYQAALAGRASVALLRRGDDLLVLPVAGPEAGGFLVKQVNARGDRAVHAADFFRLNGVDETIERFAMGAWDEAAAGFVVPGLFRQTAN